MVQRYPSDLSDVEREIIHRFYASQYKRQGRPPSKQLRELWNGMFYVLRSGFSWPMRPRDFPPWRAVYKHFRLLKVSGRLEMIMQELHKQARQSQGKEESPSIAIVDSQSFNNWR